MGRNIVLNRFLLVTVLACATLLSACDSAEERAEAHYQRGLELLAEGDVARAVVEFRNVFQLDGFHRDARFKLAEVLEAEQGDIQGAYSQLLRLIEQYPEDFEGRRMLVRLALEIQNWDEIERHVEVARGLNASDPVVATGIVALNYRAAMLEQDFAGASAAAEAAATLIAGAPDMISARRIVIDDLVRQQDWTGAVAAIDGALELRPEDRRLHAIRLGVLEQLGDEVGIRSHLEAMAELFSEDEQVRLSLIRWYMSRGLSEEAEEYLRSRTTKEDAEDGDFMALISFILQAKGAEPALAEVDRVLALPNTNTQLLRSVGAGIRFDSGDRDVAIAEMEAILEGAESSEQTHRIKLALARMLIRTENAVGARALVEEVLAEDGTQVEALKLKANWLIDDDRTGDAIVDLRQALDQSPDDPQVMTLLARAYDRAGNRELVGEMLSLAVEASGNAPAESLRFAAHLLTEGSEVPAEQVLLDALRLQPGNLELLSQLGNVYIRMEDWSRTDQVIGALNRVDDPQAEALVKELTARLLAAQNREKELVDYLSGLAEGGELQGAAAVIRLRLAQGDIAGALEYAQEILAEDPQSPVLRFIEAMVLAADEQIETAADRFRSLLEDVPEGENIWLALYNLHRSQGEVDEAKQVLNEALEVLPEGQGLNWAMASEMEFDGDVDGAIEIYERLYAQNSNSPAFANNLASLISSYRPDQESLQRAFEIARRLRGTTFPPFQDTYGWIAHQLGNHEEALTYLEPAAQAIPDDPLVLYHLAAVYAALDRDDDALPLFERALQLIEENGIRREAQEKITAAFEAFQASQAAAEN